MDFVIICRKALYFRGSLSICPAYAGMILMKKLQDNGFINLSRVCGDDPIEKMFLREEKEFVPRMRG